mmetsp:Transcript_1435/g.4378  ORF Transcript_1435/g.4378 Transcript_1435/m.4378 type:complete len:259 (+) Transcript_1435:413-1189(+)
MDRRPLGLSLAAALPPARLGLARVRVGARYGRHPLHRRIHALPRPRWFLRSWRPLLWGARRGGQAPLRRRQFRGTALGLHPRLARGERLPCALQRADHVPAARATAAGGGEREAGPVQPRGGRRLRARVLGQRRNDDGWLRNLWRGEQRAHPQQLRRRRLARHAGSTRRRPLHYLFLSAQLCRPEGGPPLSPRLAGEGRQADRPRRRDGDAARRDERSRPRRQGPRRAGRLLGRHRRVGPDIRLPGRDVPPECPPPAR